MPIRDRIKELRRVPARSLRPNARNWRTHPDRQRAALRGVLAEIGYAGALLARELPDGSLELIDGHLRAETTPDALVPVLVLDLDQAEADKLLATFDPLAALAETNGPAMAALLADIEADNAALCTFLDGLAAELPSAADAPASLPDEQRSVELYQVVVECADEEQQRAVYEEFTGRGWKCRLLNL